MTGMSVSWFTAASGPSGRIVDTSDWRPYAALATEQQEFRDKLGCGKG
jgi:hypothetical protein